MGWRASDVIPWPNLAGLISRRCRWRNAPLPAIRVDHVALRADRPNFEAARRELPAKGIPIVFQDHEISHSIYFSDPDGHRLEITTYDLA